MLQITSVTRDNVSLEWLAPIYNGGSDVTRYVVMMQRRPYDIWEEVASVSPLTTTYTVQGLREGKEYLFGVYAVNSVGKGDCIETVRPVTPKRFVGTSGFDISYYDSCHHEACSSAACASCTSYGSFNRSFGTRTCIMQHCVLFSLCAYSQTEGAEASRRQRRQLRLGDVVVAHA